MHCPQEGRWRSHYPIALALRAPEDMTLGKTCALLAFPACRAALGPSRDTDHGAQIESRLGKDVEEMVFDGRFQPARFVLSGRILQHVAPKTSHSTAALPDSAPVSPGRLDGASL